MLHANAFLEMPAGEPSPGARESLTERREVAKLLEHPEVVTRGWLER